MSLISIELMLTSETFILLYVQKKERIGNKELNYITFEIFI